MNRDLASEWEEAEPVDAPGVDEESFRDWYDRWAQIAGIDPDPDNPEHKYDYRAAFNAGAAPEVDEDSGEYHWPSRFKADDHPRRFVGNMDTKYGRDLQAEFDAGDPWVPASAEKAASANRLAAGGALPETAAAARNTDAEEGSFLGGLGVLAQRVPSIATDYVPLTVGEAWRGGRRSILNESAVDRWIEENKRESEASKTLTPEERGKTWFTMPFTGQKVTYGDAEEAAPAIAYSLVNLAASQVGKAIGALAGGAIGGAATGPAAPAGAVVGGMAGGILGGVATGSIVSGEATKDQFVDTIFKAFKKTHPEKTEENERLWQEIYKEIESDADWYGFWEAAPETVGNMLTMGIAGLGKKVGAGAAFAPLKNKVAAEIGESIALKLGIPVAKAGAMLTEEMLTEAFTAMKQSQIDVKYGLREAPLEFPDALVEVAPQTLINTAVMGGVASGASAAKAKYESVKTGNAIDRVLQDLVADVGQQVDQGRLTAAEVAEMAKAAKPGSAIAKALQGIAGEAQGEAPGAELKPPEDVDIDNLRKYLSSRMEEQEITIEASEGNRARGMVQKAGEVFGRKVVFYRGEGAADGLNGVYDDKSDTIFINESAENPYLVVLGHESLHRLKQLHPDLYSNLEFLTEGLETEFDPWLGNLNKGRKAVGLRELDAEDAIAKEEFRADFVGQQFGKKEFWEKLHAEEPSVAQRLAEYVFELVEKIRKYLRSEKAEPQYFQQINQVQDALAAVYGEFARRETRVKDATVQPVAREKSVAQRALEAAGELIGPSAAEAKVGGVTIGPGRTAILPAVEPAAPSTEGRPVSQQEWDNAEPIELTDEIIELTEEVKPAAIAKVQPIETPPETKPETKQSESPAEAGASPASAETATETKPPEGETKQAEFDRLWSGLRADQRKRLAEVPRDDEMSIDEKIGLVKAEMATKRAKKPKAPRVKQAGESKVTTLRGRIKKMGGIKFLNFKGELKDMSTAVKFLSKKTGEGIDLAEQTLRNEGWLRHDEALLDVLRDPNGLRRGKVAGETVEKRPEDLTEQEKRVKAEMEYEPEEPPPGDYITMNAEDLPEGRKIVAMDLKTARGWDIYEVVEKDPFSITLQDGEIITLSPYDRIEVRRQDVDGKDIAASVKQLSLFDARPAAEKPTTPAKQAELDFGTKPAAPQKPAKKEPWQKTKAELLREMYGLSQDAIDAYDPERVVEKSGRFWGFKTLQGNDHPGNYNTRKEAVEAAKRHKELKEDQLKKPEAYFDLVQKEASERLDGIKRLTRGGMSEMDAAKQMPPHHREAVQQAINEGKPVPPEVLADYPDLVPAKEPAGEKPEKADQATAAAKEPWEMTAGEYRHAQTKPVFDAVQKALKEGKRLTFATQLHAWELSRPDQLRLAKNGFVEVVRGREWDRLGDSQVEALGRQVGIEPVPLKDRVFHRAAVEEALEAGKPVPPEVQAEYPDLKKPEKTKATAPAPSRSWFALGQLVAQEYTNQDKTGKTTILKPDASIVKKAAEALGISTAAATRAIAVYNAENPREEAKRFAGVPVPETGPRVKKPSSRPDKGKITDAGEELFYNKRNRMGAGIRWADVETLNETLRAREVTKSKVWPRPDYQQLVDDGMPVFAAHILKQVYDTIPTGPSKKGDDDLKFYINEVQRIREAVFQWVKDNQAVRSLLGKLAIRAGAVVSAIRGGSPVSLADLSATSKSLFNLVYPDFERKDFYEGGKYRRSALLLGSKKFLNAIQPGTEEARKASKAIFDEGWPSAQESWQRQGVRIVEKTEAAKVIEGYRYVEGKKSDPVYYVEFLGRGATKGYDSREEAERYIRGLKPWLVIDKRHKLVGDFDTREQATGGARERVKRERGQVTDKRIAVAEATRKGPAAREPGQNITPEQVMEKFGFRGVNFGNWTNQAERQASLNVLYDSLADLSDILRVPPRALSLSGMLGLAFGAQGTGQYGAHFVPGVNEINLTKTRGAGALAHEWGHALDHWFATQADLQRREEPYLSEAAFKGAKPSGKVRPEIFEAFQKIMAAIRERPATPEELARRAQERHAKDLKSFNSWLGLVRGGLSEGATEGTREQALKEFDELAERLRNGDMGEGYVTAGKLELPQVVAQMRLLALDKAPKNYRATATEHWKAISNWARTFSYRKNNLEASKSHTPQMLPTEYAQGAAELDREKSGKKYWTNSTELFARAFESYVLDRLDAAQRQSDYLTYPVADEEKIRYPYDKEREAINAEFDKLVDTVEARETEPGKVGLFSVKAEVPKFKRTDDAVDFGEKATPEQVAAMRERAAELHAAYNELKAQPRTKESMARMLDLAYDIQFVEEALDVAKYVAAGEKVIRRRPQSSRPLIASVKREHREGSNTGVPEFHNTQDAFAFGRDATDEQIAEMERMMLEIRARAKDLLDESRQSGDEGKLDEAVRITFDAQFLREAIEAARGAPWVPKPNEIDMRSQSVVKFEQVKEGLIDEEDTTLEPAPTFSVKWRPPTNQLGLPFSTEPAVEAAAELPQAASQPQPTEAPPKRPASTISATQRVRMVTTGHLAAAGNVVRNIDDAAALVAPIRKSAQELVFAITTGEDGTVLEVHRYSKGTASAAHLLPADVIGHVMNVPGAQAVYVFHNHPGGSTNPSVEDVAVVKNMEAMASLSSGLTVVSGIIAGTKCRDITGYAGGMGVDRLIRPTIRKAKIPIRERYLVQTAPLPEQLTHQVQLVEYLEKNFPKANGFLFVNAINKPVGFLPFPGRTSPAAVAVEVIKAAEYINARGFFAVLPERAKKHMRDFIKELQIVAAGALHLHDVVEGGKPASVMSPDRLKEFKAVSQGSADVAAAAAGLRTAGYEIGPDAEGKFSVRRDTDRRFAAGISRWKDLRPTQSVQLDYTPDVLRMLGAENLPLEIDRETIRKVLEPAEMPGGKHGRINIQALMDLPVYLNSPVMVFDSKTRPGAIVVMAEMVDEDGDTVIAAIHVGKTRGHRTINDIASVYGKDDERFFLREIEAGRLRYVNQNKSRRWAQSSGLYLPLEAFPPTTDNTVLTDDDLVKFIREGMPLFSLKRMSPVMQTYLDALKAATPDQFVSDGKDITADPYEGLDDAVKGRLGAAKGIPIPSLLQKSKIHGRDVWHSMTRHRPYLDPREEATIADILRTHQDTPENSVRRAMQVLQAIVGGMQPKQYDVFTLSLLMDDMIRDIESGLLAGKESLPFGFTEQTAREYQQRIGALADSDPVVRSAIKRRNAFQKKLKTALVKADLLPAAVLEDERYFHHEVLKYKALEALGEAYGGIGVGPAKDVRMKKKGWQIDRVGSVEDYNTDYTQAEFEVIAQALAQLETRHVMEQIKDRADITGNLKEKAKRMNYVAIVGGEENFARLVDLRAQSRAIRGTEDKLDSEDKKLLKLINDEIWQLDPTMPYRQNISIGLQKLGKALGMDADDIGFDDEALSMREIAKYAKSDDNAVSIPARMIFKAITERNTFMRQTLGARYAEPASIMPEGYVEWRPAPGKSWYKAYGITDRLLAAVQAGEVVIGPETAGKIREVLARGRDATWIIPSDLAKTLDGYDQQFEDHLLSKASRTLMNAWKQWILINPFRVIKYNLNNLSGDLDIAFAYDPRIITKYLPAAIKSLTQEYRGRNLPAELQKELDLVYSLGVLSSGWSVQEVSEVTSKLAMKEHMQALRGEKPHLIARAWRGLREFTQYRENWLRLAAFRFFRDELAAGKKVFGASNAKEVDGIDDADRKAAKLARELIGDYGNLTHAGQFIRRHLIPFWAWSEINAPRYVRMMRNLKHEGKEGAGGRAAAVIGKNIAWKATKLGAKMAAFFVMASLWNRTFFADEEDELGEEQRRQMHLILGRRPDGSIISIRLQGAFSDALSWFGAEDVMSDVEGLIKGKKSIGKVATDSALATPIKIINGLRPDAKVAGEVIGGRFWYPDPFNPKPIRDKLEHVARTFSLNSLYGWLAGKPKRGDSVSEQLANDLLSLGFYTADPGEMAYYDTTRLVREWKEKQGKETPAIVPTDKANALYYYKQGLKYGDLTAAEKYLRKYHELGGTEKGLAQSIQRLHPLGGIAKKEWRAFLDALGPEEKERFDLALKWYEQSYKGPDVASVRAAARRVESEERAEAEEPAVSPMTIRDALQLIIF
jgi:hypothetical protein